MKKLKSSAFLYIVTTMLLTSCGYYTSCPTYAKGKKKIEKPATEESFELTKERV